MRLLFANLFHLLVAKEDIGVHNIVDTVLSQKQLFLKRKKSLMRFCHFDYVVVLVKGPGVVRSLSAGHTMGNDFEI